jgi:aquaporin Z
MKKLIIELIGSFFLVLTALMVTGEMAPIAIGAVAIAMMFAGGKISGGHYNPAVSLAVFIQGKMLRDELPLYILGQTGGAILAAMIAGVLAPCALPAITYTLVSPIVICGILCEFLAAFALVYVFLSTAAADSTGGKLAVGALLMALLAGISKISGGGGNPMLATGAAISGVISWGNLLLYSMCHFLAAAAASTVHTLLDKEVVSGEW